MPYKIVCVILNESVDLERAMCAIEDKVNSLLDEDWEVLGCPSISNRIAVQALVKRQIQPFAALEQPQPQPQAQPDKKKAKK
jgi:hypothetical protein